MNKSQHRPDNWLYAGIGLITLGSLALEIALTRLFSISLWHYFGFMIVSVALLGLGGGGALVAAWPRLAEGGLKTMRQAALVFALTTAGSLLVMLRLPLDPFRLDQPAQIIYLLVYYVVALLPFLAVGICMSVALRIYARDVARVYFADLIGAGLGALLVLPGLNTLGAPLLIALTGATGALAAGAFNQIDGSDKKGWRGIAGSLVLVGVVAVLVGGPLGLHIAESKTLGYVQERQTNGVAGSEVLYSQWNAVARVDVFTDRDIERQLSTLIAGEGDAAQLPEVAWISYDGDALTPLVRNAGALGEELAVTDGMLPGLVYALDDNQNVLVIGSGGGIDVATALYNGAAHVTAVEINPVTTGLVTTTYDDYLGGLFTRPDVTLVTGDGRHYVQRADDRFDVIQLTLVDTWAATGSGALSLSESYLYSVEAVGAYYAILSDGGTLSVTRWLLEPPRESLRLVSVAREALADEGIARPEEHIAVVGFAGRGNFAWASLLVRQTPYTAQDVAALQTIAAARGAEVLYPLPAGENNAFSDFLGADDVTAFYAAYPYQITPTDDDQPFFFQYYKWSNLLALGSGGIPSVATLPVGNVTLLAVLAQSICLSVLLLFGPLVVMRRQQRPRAGWGAFMIYFAGLGLGFIMLEISLMQRFVLFLGHPVYAVSALFFTLLVSTGLGSLLSATQGITSPARAWRFAGLLTVLVAAYIVGLPALFDALLGAALAVRVLVTIVTLAPLGVLLGTAFPSGIRLAEGRNPALIPWAWAVNSCLSVLGSLLAPLVALSFGFRVVTLVALVVYWLAMVSATRILARG